MCSQYVNLPRDWHRVRKTLGRIHELGIGRKRPCRIQRIGEWRGCLEEWAECGREILAREGVQLVDWDERDHVPGGQSERWVVPSWTSSTVQCCPFSTSV